MDATDVSAVQMSTTAAEVVIARDPTGAKGRQVEVVRRARFAIYLAEKMVAVLTTRLAGVEMARV